MDEAFNSMSIHSGLTHKLWAIILLVIVAKSSFAKVVDSELGISVEIDGMPDPHRQLEYETKLLEWLKEDDESAVETFLNRELIERDWERSSFDVEQKHVFIYTKLPRHDPPTELTKDILFSMDFQHGGGVYGRMKCHLADMQQAFPDLRVERSLVEVYRANQKGFQMFVKDYRRAGVDVKRTRALESG